jgi:hypothetical protein
MKLVIFALSICLIFSPLPATGQCRDIEEDLNVALSDLGAGRRGKAWERLDKLLDAPTLRGCDDGGIAEGLSDLTVRLLSDMPDALPRLAELYRFDNKKYLFILKHLDGTASCDDLLNLERTLRSQYSTIAPLVVVRTKVLGALSETKCPRSPSPEETGNSDRKICEEGSPQKTENKAR